MREQPLSSGGLPRRRPNRRHRGSTRSRTPDRRATRLRSCRIDGRAVHRSSHTEWRHTREPAIRATRRGRAGWLGWLALLYGAILCDWIDGPLARRFGTSEVGSLFDLESDSWLTLCAAGSAVAWGDLPTTVAVPACLRYLVMFFALRATGYAE